MINNAATLPSLLVENPADKAKFNSIEHFEAESLLKIFAINSIAPLIVIKHFAPLLKNANQAKIIQISSISGSIEFTTQGGAYAYSASKAALNMFTKVLAADFRQDEIVVVAVHPGSVQTRMGRSTANLSPTDSAEKILKLIKNLKFEDSGKFLDLDGNKLPF